MRMHPDGVASLIAAMTVPPKATAEEYAAHCDKVRRQVLTLARSYYRLYPVDFDQAVVRHDHGANNLAKLNRANLR
jgi:hypothetical protein